MASTNVAPTPSQQALNPAQPVYGQITLDGLNYIERHQIFVDAVTITTPNQVLTNQRLSLPGVADFLLKGLGRDFTIPNSPTSHDRIFRFRIVNSEATTWFFTGGLGVFDDRVFDALCFGNAQFPFFIIPPVPVHANGNLVYEIEDVQALPPNPPDYPYVIHLAFYGAYIIPASGSGAAQGPLAFGGGNGTISSVYSL